MNRKNVLKRKIEKIKREEEKKKFVESMNRKYRFYMLSKSVGLVSA